MPPEFPMKKVLGDDDDGGDSPQNEGPVTFEIDEEYARRLNHNRQREDLQRLEELERRGVIVDEEDDESDSEDAYNPDDDDFGEFLKLLNKAKRGVLSTTEEDGEKEEDEKEKDEKKEKKKEEKEKKKKKKMYLKDVQAQQLLEEGPDFAEKDEERKSKTYIEEHEELRRGVHDALEAGGSDDDEDLLKVKEGDDSEEEEDEELEKKADEYFGDVSELDERNKFLRDYLVKQMWKEKDAKSKLEIDEAELDQLEEDEEAVWDQEDYERINFRHEENAGDIVTGHSRIVKDTVRKKNSARKAQRKNKEERMKMAEIERQEDLKRLKNVKKEEMKEKMKKVLSIAGFKEGEECPLDARDLDDDFDPEEYDKMMKAAFDDKYYDDEDSGLGSDEDDDDDEKPDFEKEDELLGLPKDWDVIQGGDGFVAAREKALKHKENYTGDEEEEEEEEEEEVDEEEEREGKRKRKRKTSLVQRAKEALMEEYYKLDYEDTIGDLQTRFKYAKVQPNSYELEPEEILFVDDKELNQYVPLKKMAPYMDKDWEVNKYKVKEQKHKFSELLQRIGSGQDEKRSKKKKKSVVEETETKPAPPVANEEDEAETSKLSRNAKRRRRQAEKKLPPNRMVAYGKTN